MEVANTLAYYNVATITVLKSFVAQSPGLTFKNWTRLEITDVTSFVTLTPGANVIKHFTAVIYEFS